MGSTHVQSTLPLPMRPAHAPSAGAWPAAGLAFVLLLASLRWVASSAARDDLLGDGSYMLYPGATLAFNYFEFGAVRRGLGGSLLHLTGLDLRIATLGFHVVSAAALAAAIGLLFRRIEGSRWVRAAFALTALALMARWAEDAVGRTDLAVAALLAFATLAVRAHRPVAAGLLVGSGLFIHETSMILGAPLLMALFVVQRGEADGRGRWHGREARLDAARLAGVLGACLALYIGMAWLPHADTATMIAAVRAKFPPHRFVDWAIYFAVSGNRGVRTSVCQNATDPNFWLHLGSGLLLIGVIAFALGRTLAHGRRALLFAAVPAYVFLAVAANDNARWITLACFNLWLVAAVASRNGVRAARHRPVGAAAALAFLLLTHPKAAPWSPTPLFEASPFIERLVRKLGGPPTPTFAEALERCDPGWREAVGLRLVRPVDQPGDGVPSLRKE